MNILILGDCASAGTNVLTPYITGHKGAIIEYSLTWGNKYWKNINAWYLKETKNKRNTIKDIKTIPFDAVKYLVEQELANSYWKHIPVDVDNRSKNGTTAGGYYKRLLKYEKTKGRPDVIFVTDHTISHKWQVINHKGQKYFFEKNFDERQPEFRHNPQLTAPLEVQQMAFEKSKDTHFKGLVEKRNKRIMSWFLRFLEKNNYKFYKIKFYNGFEEFDNDQDVLDCSDLVEKYTEGHGDRVDIKIEVAPLIAQRIQNKFTWLTDNQ